MKGEAIPRVELELACTSSQEPMIDLPGTVQTQSRSNWGHKSDQVGNIYTMEIGKSYKSGNTTMHWQMLQCYNASPYLPKKADYSVFPSTSLESAQHLICPPAVCRTDALAG